MAQKPREFVDGVSRREFIAASGAIGLAGLAGCQGNPNDQGDDGTTQGGAGDGTTQGATTGGEETTDGGSSGELSGEINIAGSSTVFPLANAMKEEFQKEHGDVSINIQSTGSGGGFQNHFCPGNTDFNNASRPIKDEEAQLCSDNGVEPVELKVATDALTVIVNPDADWVDCVTVEQLKQIWQKDGAQNWSDVNSDWPDEQIELYGPTEASGTFDYFNEVIIGEESEHRMDHQATENDRQIVQGVQNSQYAIGYFGFAYYTETQDSVKGLAIDNGDGCVEPSLETAKSGEYAPLARPLFTYPAKSALAEEHIAEFARFWIENASNQEIVANQVGYVPLGDDEKSEQMDALETAIQEAQG